VLDRVRTAEKLPGVSEIVLPGQRESALAAARVRDGSVPLERNMLAELRVLAANYEAASARAPAAVGGGEQRTNALLEQLLTRLDKLEGQVMATAAQQQQLGKQQERLETVAVESLRAANGGR
jgi:hypothetical protein